MQRVRVDDWCRKKRPFRTESETLVCIIIITFMDTVGEKLEDLLNLFNVDGMINSDLFVQLK